MNHIYRLVWSRRLGGWVAAAEISKGQRKGQGVGQETTGQAIRSLIASLCGVAIGIIGLGGSSIVLAQGSVETVVPSGGRTNAYLAPNGVPVVDINTANSSGLSHNVFSRYDVDTKGLVLNNANSSQITRDSLLAGQVIANMNLGQEASIILNEVVSSRRSVLNGFTEVLGGKAEVIVANPSGISCNGCGFINTDRVTLTTGQPLIGNAGVLDGFSVRSGNILIEGVGANITDQQVFDLVARSVRVDGPLVGSDKTSVGITTGAYQWNYAARDVKSAQMASDAAPSYALDSTALGGMYAGRIRIIATEAGMGVRMLGEAAASADDFSISSAGKVELRAATSAAGDLLISSTSTTGNADISISGSAATLASEGDLKLQAAAGQVVLNEGDLYAGGNLMVQANKLYDVSAAATAASRYAEGESSFEVAGETVMRGTAWGAGSRMAAYFDSLDLREDVLNLYSAGELNLETRGDITLDTAMISAGTDLILTSREGAISTASGEGQGVQGGTSVVLSAASGVNNAGVINADTGELRIRSGGSVTNTGDLHAGTNIDIAGIDGGASVNLINNGIALADTQMKVVAASLVNTGTLQAGTGSNLDITGSLTNANGARLDLGTQSGAISTLSATHLNNQGTLQTAGDAAFNIGSTLNNSGRLVTGGDLQLRGKSPAAYTVNTSGRLEAGGELDIAGQNNSKTVQLALDTGAVVLGNTLSINAIDVSLASAAQMGSKSDFTMQADSLLLAGVDSRLLTASEGGSSRIELAGSFSNPGLVFSGGTLQLSASSITNTQTGSLAAIDSLQLQTSGALTNSGSLYSGQQTTLQVGDRLTNVGTRTGAIGSVDSGGDISVVAGEFLNQSNFAAAGDISINSLTVRNEVEGGDSRKWVYNSNYNHTEESTRWYEFPDDYETINHTETWTDYQYHDGGTPTYKPQIIAGGLVDVSGFDSGINMAAVISGETIRLTGNGASATFVNDDLSLIKRDYTKTWDENVHYIALGPGEYSREESNFNTSFSTTTTYQPTAVGLFATTLEASGFGLTNAGSPYAASVNSTNSPGGLSSTGLADALGFGGLNLSVPTSPNGVFVVSKDSDAEFLIESNPLFDVGQDFIGSDYMAERYGYNPDTTVKRLGDANYEAYLIRQQLVQQTGSNLLAGSTNEADRMQKLMENGLDEASRQGLIYGQAPSAEQLASLTNDIVWMVETMVDGQTVLAPVVYLAPTTRDAIATGPVIAANTTTLSLETLNNIGGTIAGGESLDITTRGDITNTSGTLRGGDVSLESTEGSVVNQTLAEGSGGDNNYQTTIGKQAGIEATGDLSISAVQDIKNLGANMSAGGNAVLDAGNDITFDTVQDRTTTSTSSSRGRGLNSSSSTSTTTTVNQVRSGLTVGGNLDATAGNDITLAGSNANVGGNANINAGGDLNIIARENIVETSSTSRQSGFGVGGGTYGTAESSASSVSSRNQGSSLNIGGNANLSAGDTMTIQGSDLDVGGDAQLSAQEVQVLAGKDVDRSSSSSSTTSYMSGADDGVTLSQTTTTETSKLSQRSVGSNVGIGGNLTINAKDTLRLQGSDVASGGDLDVQAGNVELLAAQNIEESSSTTTMTSVGLYASNNNESDSSSDAGTEAGAEADANGPEGANVGSAEAGASAEASAEAEASGSTSNTLDVARIQKDTSVSRTVKNTGSSLRSGGNMTLNVDNKLRAVGSEIAADGNVDLSAQSMSFEAAQDSDYSRTTSSTTSVGLYANAGGEASGSAGVEAGASAGLGNNGVGGEASAGAEAEGEASGKAGIGIVARNLTETEESGSFTAVVSAIRSGLGSITRKAKELIRDIGTAIEAALDFNQSAENIESLAAENSQFSRKTSEETVARVGVYAEAEVSAGVGAGTEAGVSAEGGAGASIEAGAEASAEAKTGIEATVDRSVSRETMNATQAVTSNIKVGGNINSRSSGKTTLQGTNVDAGGDINLAAKSLEVKAARDTYSATKTEETISTRAAVNVGVAAEAEAGVSASTDGEMENESSAEAGARVGVEASAEYGRSQSSESSSTAVVSNISGGGRLNIQTTDNTSLEGTNLSGGSGVDIDAGSLDFSAAKDTYSSSSSELSVSADAAGYGGLGNDNDVAVEGSVDTFKAQESGSNAVVGSINSGGGVNIITRNDTRLEGTNIKADGDTNVAAGGNVTVDAARNTYQSSASSVNASVSVDTGEGKVNAAGGFSKEQVQSSEAVTSNISSGGAFNISAGKNARFEGADIEADGDAQVAADGNVSFDAARNTYSAKSSGMQVEVGVGGSEEEDEEGTATSSNSASIAAEGYTSSESSSEAVTGGIRAGNNLKVTSGGNTRFEGTSLDAGNGAQIDAGGSVNFDAATSTSSSSDMSVGFAAGKESTSTRDVSDEGDDSSPEVESESSAELSLEINSEKSLNQQGVTLNAGSGGIQINAGKNVNLQGADMVSDGEKTISAGGKVNKTEAVSQSSSSSISLDLNTSEATSSEDDGEAEDEE